MADRRHAVPQISEVGNLADRVRGHAEGAFRNHAPTAAAEGHGDMRIKVDSAYVAGVETRLRSADVAKRGPESPVNGRGEQRAVENIVAKAGQVQNPGFVAVGRAGKSLEAIERQRRDASVAGVRYGDVARHFRTDGLGEIVVEDQPVQVAGKVFHGACCMGMGREVLASFGNHVHSALVHQFVAGRAGNGGIWARRGLRG